jgi:hypothetical protein
MITVSAKPEDGSLEPVPGPNPAFDIANRVLNEWDRQNPVTFPFVGDTYPSPVQLDVVIAVMAALAGIDPGQAATPMSGLVSVSVETAVPRSYVDEQLARHAVLGSVIRVGEPAQTLGTIVLRVLNPASVVTASLEFEFGVDGPRIWADIFDQEQNREGLSRFRIHLGNRIAKHHPSLIARVKHLDGLKAVEQGVNPVVAEDELRGQLAPLSQREFGCKGSLAPLRLDAKTFFSLATRCINQLFRESAGGSAQEHGKNLQEDAQDHRKYWLLPEGVMVEVDGEKLPAGNIHAMPNGRWVMRFKDRVLSLGNVKLVETTEKP